MSGKKQKVCHVIATAEGGTWMFEQLRELRNQYGYEVYAIVSDTEGALVDKLKSANIPFFVANFSFGTSKPTWKFPFALYQLAKIFRRERFDVVQTHLFYSMIMGRIASWLADVPLRIEMLASPFHLLAHTSRWIDQSTAWMDNVLIPSCQKTVELCRGIGVSEENISLIYYSPDENNFVPDKFLPSDIRQEFGWADDTPIIANVAIFYPRLSIGSWIPKYLHNKGVKGHEDLVKSMPFILSEFPNAKLLLIGNGWFEAGDAYMEEIKTMVAEMKLEKSIVFPGYRSDVNRILLTANVAVQASLEENVAGTVEALLMKTPLVVTRVGGMIDTVIEGKTGILVKPENPKDLARGISEMLRNPEQAKQFGENGRKFMLENFTLTRTVSQLNELYQRKLDQNKRNFFNPFVSLYRTVLCVPILFYIAFRLIAFDLFIPIYLPSYAVRLKWMFIRFFYWNYGLLLKSYYFARLILIYVYYAFRYLPAKIYGLLISIYSGGRKLIDDDYRLKLENSKKQLSED
jgi:glycosyltransferase involved in cell wall biosynthesis